MEKSAFVNFKTTRADFPALKTIEGNFLEKSTAEEANVPSLVSISGTSCFSSMKNLTDLYLPETLVTVCSKAFASGWTTSQTIHIPFAEGKLPSGWASDWLATSCKAKVVYGDVDGSAL